MNTRDHRLLTTDELEALALGAGETPESIEVMRSAYHGEAMFRSWLMGVAAAHRFSLMCSGELLLGTSEAFSPAPGVGQWGEPKSSDAPAYPPPT